MSKKMKWRKSLIKQHLEIKRTVITKQRFELGILIVLVLFVVAAQVSGLYPYLYNYAICKSAPIEVRGKYYRFSSDENYGIHIGSDYSRCFNGKVPNDLQRDPETEVAKKNAVIKEKEAARVASISDYIVYKPEGYRISSYVQSDNGDRLETRFIIDTDTGTKFDVSEMKKGSSFDYVKTCYKPPTENWSGTIIGVDTQGREICKTNLSKYVTKYTVGMYIDDTAIIMRTKNTSEAALKNEVIKIFSSMKSSS